MVNAFKPELFEANNFPKSLQYLILDTDIKIQQTLSSGLHEVSLYNQVCSVLGTNSFNYLKDPLLNLLHSSDLGVLDALFSNMPKILASFHVEDSNSSKNQIVIETVFTKILDIRRGFDEYPNKNWRIHAKILETFKILPSIMDSEIVYEQCVPILLKVVFQVFFFNKAYPAKLKSLGIQCLVVFMRNLKRLEFQEAILRQLLGKRN